MNKEDIIRMAQEAGAEFAELPRGDAWLFTDDECLERFATIVASAAQAKEREACAKLCEQDDSMRWSGAANAIRARGQA